MRSRSWRLPGLALLLLLLLLPGLATAQGTYPRDVTGAVAPPVNWQEPSGTFNTVTSTTPLPVTGATSPVPVSQTTRGYGKLWTLASGVTTTNSIGAPVVMPNSDLAVFKRNTASNLVEVWRTRDGGISWQIALTSTLSTGDEVVDGLVESSTGQVFLLIGAGTNRILSRSLTLSTWTTVQDFAANFVRPMGLGLQGNTMAVVGSTTGTSQVVWCRSTTLGADGSFTCANLSTAQAVPSVAWSLTTPTMLATPSASVWLLTTAGGAAAPVQVWRSTDDGVTWAVAFTAPVNGRTQGPSLACISATICLMSDYANLYRSTDAGATWTTVTAVPANTCCYGFANFGSGLLAGLGNRATGLGSLVSSDSGATWSGASATSDTAPTGIQVGPAVVKATTGGWAVAGGAWGQTQTANSVIQSRPLRSNESVGNQGLPFGQNATSGNLVVDQGAAAAITAPWPTQLSNGTVAFGTATAPLRTDPTGTTGQPVTVAAQSAGTAALPVSPIQGGTLFNSQTTGAANTAVVVTITAAAGTRAHLYGIDARCSAGTATLTVENPAGTTIWSEPAGAVGTTDLRVTWPVALTGATNVNLVITLTACGAANTGTLIVQADQY